MDIDLISYFGELEMALGTVKSKAQMVRGGTLMKSMVSAGRRCERHSWKLKKSLRRWLKIKYLAIEAGENLKQKIILNPDQYEQYHFINHSLFTREQEYNLFHRLSMAVDENERIKIRDEIILGNIRLIVSIANKRQGRGLAFGDLLSEGVIGIMTAIDKFDHERGIKFSTYATWWIKQTLNRAISGQVNTIRLPVHISEQVVRVKKKMWQMRLGNGNEISLEELANEVGLKVDKVKELLEADDLNSTLSLDQQMNNWNDVYDNGEFHTFIEDERVSVHEEVERNELREKIDGLLESLSAREAKIIKLRYGLVDGKEWTLEEIGNKFNLTRERIRQVEAKAMKLLRHTSRKRQLKEYA